MKTFKLDGNIAMFDYDGKFGKWIGPKSVANWLHTLKDGEEAEIEINSCGGSVGAGLAIANGIKNSKAHIRAHIVGLAASMASVVACACETVVMEEGALVMIHDPWVSGMDGNAEDLRKEADVLDLMKQTCMGFYRAKFDKTEEEISAMMSDETWWNGHDAVEHGFKCDVVASDAKLCACVCGFKNVPEEARKFVKDPVDAETMAKIEAEVAERERAEKAAADLERTVSERIASAMKSRDTEINDLKAKLAEAQEKAEKAALEVVDYGALKAELAKARNDLADKTKDFEDQLAKAKQELTDAQASVTSLTARAEQAEQEFANARDQLAELQKAHASLMGGVLTPGPEKALRTAEEISRDASLTPAEKSKLIGSGEYVK